MGNQERNYIYNALKMVEDDNTIRNIVEIRRHIEKAFLKYSLSITSQKKSKCGKNNPVSNRKKLSTARKKIRCNLSHPRMGNQERNYIYNALKMVDRFFFNRKRMIRFDGKIYKTNELHSISKV